MPATTRKRRSTAAYVLTHDGAKYHAMYVINDELVVPTRKHELKARMGFSSVVSRKVAGGNTVLYVPLAEYKDAVRQREAAGIKEGSLETSSWDWKHLRIRKGRHGSLAGTPKKGSGTSCGVSPDVTAAAHGTAAGKPKSARVLATKGRKEARKRAAAGCRKPGYVPVTPARKKLVRKEGKARLALINAATRKLYDKPGNKKSWVACTKAASTQLKRAGQL